MSAPELPGTPAVRADPGRWIRRSLVLFPLGLIITSFISFGIWWQKKQATESRSYAHATALRRDMTPAGLDRMISILLEALAPSAPDRIQAGASFMESSMSAENMGYEPRRDRFVSAGTEFSIVDVELTGKTRPREVNLMLLLYGDPLRVKEEAHALAGMMALGHAVTGERREQTLRLALCPEGATDEQGRSALKRLYDACESRRERIMSVTLIGGPTPERVKEVTEALQTEHRGTRLETHAATQTVEETLEHFRSLQGTFLQLR